MRVNCLHCNRPLSISADHLGGEVVCPHCQGTVRLPEAEVYETAERRHSTSVTGSWISNSVSGLVSLIAHMGLLLLFAVITCDYRGGGGGEGEEVLIADLPVENLSENPDEELDADDAAAQAEEIEDLDETLEVLNPIDSSDGEISMEEIDPANLLPGASGGGSPAISALAGAGGGLGEGASFMGLHAKGTRFCIIADRSGSMEGPKLSFVKEEILETLTTMGSRGRFQLIFFNTRELPYRQEGWRHPRRDRADVAAWLQSVSAGGGTYPTPAFRVAFALSPRPDAIFFMTDGQFPENVVEEVADLNRRGGKNVQIHTISFMDTSAETLMRKIASDSGGRYRHVSGF
jgi:hypothetical protein